MQGSQQSQLGRRPLQSTWWLLFFVAFAAWTAWRLGAFDLWTVVVSPDGSNVSIPNTFATVDHPFHASRAETLRRSLADGEVLRWIGNHQGGYPVEFYPLGAAWIEVIAWAAALGTLPIMAIHKLVVIGVFLLPVAGFAALARFGRLPLSVPVLAIVIHVAVRGWWWSGGYMELIEWGLLTNVASAALLPLALAWHRGFLRTSSPVLLTGAAAVASMAVYTNVRSLLPLAAILVGAALATLVDHRGRNPGRILAGSGALILLTGLLAAPLAVALFRFENLYVFVRYSTYENLTAYWDSSVQAVSTPVLALALAGSVMALIARRDDGARTVLIVLLLYVAGTSLTIVSDIASDAVTQLEATRLMPFQRLLMIYLAAYGAWALVDQVIGRLPARRFPLVDAMMLAAVLLVIGAYIQHWVPGIPASDQANGPIATTGSPAIAELRESVQLAEDIAPAGTAILVLGGTISWHDQLWAPQWSDRRFFYDDWLWYWQTDHVGEYDPLTSHAYDQDSSTLTSAYLEQHAIGAVVVTGEASGAAGNSQLLSSAFSGIWSVYRVNNPVSILTADGAPLRAIQIGNHHIEGTATSPRTVFEVRHNWYPRWVATVNGEKAEIRKDEAGYMVVESDEPGERLTLTYRVDLWDWLARAGLAVGMIVAVALASHRIARGRLMSALPGRG